MVLIQLTSTLPITPSSVKLKWPKKVFFYVLQCALYNSYVVFTKSNPNSHKSFLDYLVDVSEHLIHTRKNVSTPSSSSDELQDSSWTPAPTPLKQAPKSDPPGRLDGKLENHKPVHIPPTKKAKTPTRRCRVCIRKNIKKETIFVCTHCGIPLHPEGCYTQYHTLKHY
jgi:hypothetical protein